MRLPQVQASPLVPQALLDKPSAPTPDRHWGALTERKCIRVKHAEPHPLAGQTVKLTGVTIDGEADPLYRVEDWWDRVSGSSWMYAEGNPAALKYAMRSAMAHLPLNDEVVYGKVGPLGHIVHVNELETPA